MYVLCSPILLQHDSENWHQLAEENCGIRGDHIIVNDRFNMWTGKVLRLRDTEASELWLLIPVQADVPKC